MKQFEDRVAVVTGAASGIGLAVATALVERGTSVAMVDVDLTRLEGAAADVLAAADSVHVSTHEVDVADRDAMLALPDAVSDAHGEPIHILVNNAGVALESRLVDTTWQDIDWIVGINLMGVIHGCKAFLPSLERAVRADGEAHLVNVSSLFGLIGVPTQSLYCATKYAVRGLTEALWEEYAETALAVTLVHPGPVRTNIMRSARTHRDDARRKEGLIEWLAQEAGAMEPEEAASLILEAMEGNTRRLVFPEGAVRADAAKRRDPAEGNEIVAKSIAESMGL